MIFHFTNNFDLHNCSRDKLELVRGDSPYVVARVHGQRVIGSACFGLYDPGDFGGSSLANVTQFVAVPGDDYVDYIGILALNTDALTALVGAKDSVEVAGEWEIKYADDSGNIITVTPEKVEVLVSNDYIRQSPPSQVDPEDAYATEKFVEEVLKERVAVETEAALGGIRDEAEAAATRAEEARDTTKLAESAAGVSSESARLHALSAQDSASRASGSASSAKRSELVCEDYAKLSRESATNAASSSVAAKNAASQAQDIAGTLGSEVDDARKSAASAKTSEDTAAEAALVAKTEVGKIGNSVAESEAAASQAQASANTASGHATTAGTKATQAATSATQAATSETKSKASETASGTFATQAANSVTTAQGHASTASVKASEAAGSATSAANLANVASGHAQTAAASAITAAGHASTASVKASEAAGSATSAGASATQAGAARDAAVTAKTAAEAAADRAEAASGGGVTEAQVDTKVNTHNTSVAAHSGEFSKKLDKPTGGTTGQILTKTTTGEVWSDAPPSGVTQAQVDTSISTHDASMFAHKDAIDLVRYQFGMRIDDLLTDLAMSGEIVRVGMILMNWSNVIPVGYLPCNGGLVSKATYSKLYASRSTSGPGWGESGHSFHLPDLGARYPRGTNNGNVGIYLEDAIRNIYGTIAKHSGEKGSDIYQPTGAFGGIVLDKFIPNADNPRATNSTSMPEVSFDASRVVPTAEENRPRTTVVNFIIKY